MKKRFLLLTLIMCLLGGINSVMAQEVVTIDSDNAVLHDKVPIYANYKYSTSQQIYTAAELNIPSGSVIKSIAFSTALYDGTNPYSHKRNIEVYLVNTTQGTFSGNTMNRLSSSDKVFDGEITFASEQWITITLTNEFGYEGNNILVCVHDKTGAYVPSAQYYPYFNTFSVSGIRVLRKHNDSSYGDPTTAAQSGCAIVYNAPFIKITYVEGSSTPTAPTAPTLTSPANGATDVFNEELKFTLNDNTQEYQIVLNESTVLDWTAGESGDEVTFKPEVNYDEATAYTWKVVARCSDGGTGYLTTASEDYTFTTKNVTAAPGAISNVSPANNATDQFNPTLTWTFGENTEEYQVLLAKASADFPEVDAEKWTNTQNAAEGSYTTSGLERGTEYKWKVVTKNFKGETSSDSYTFTTLDYPEAVTPNPANGATGVSKNVTLTWTYADNTVTGYRVLFDEGYGLAYVVGNGTTWAEPSQGGTDSYVVEGLSPNTTYSWYVDVKNNAGTRGIYGCDVLMTGEPFTFTTVDDISPVTDYEIKLDGNNITLEWRYADQKANEYQVCFGGSEVEMEPWHHPYWMSRDVVEGTTLVEDDSFTFVDGTLDKGAYFRVNVRKDGGETVEGATAFFVVLDEDATWADNNANDVFVRANISVTGEAAAKNVTIENGASLTLTGSLNASKLTINDGGQLFGADKLTKDNAYFNMNINKPTEWSTENNIDGWQFISSPFTNALIEDFTNADEYDLYKYDGSNNQWFNHKKAYADGNGAVTFGTGFQVGVGYLASYRNKTTVTLDGALNTDSEFSVSKSYQNGNELANLHLLGNPFPFNMNIEKATFTNMVEGFAVVTAEGGYDYAQTTIPVGDGFFVKTTAGGAEFSYNHNAKSSRSGNANSLNIIATGIAGKDNVVINFAGKSEGFPKLQNFNDAIATVYVQNNDANYGVYNCDENTTEVELCFNANQMGNYTISVEPTGEFSSIVLVDRFTGIETNLLVEDYRFTAMSEENNNRFFIRLGNSQESTDNSHFAYVSGEDLIIEAEGTVQIIDMMGRVVYTSNVENNNRINVSDFNNAAYVVRVINENEVKVQKIIL